MSCKILVTDLRKLMEPKKIMMRIKSHKGKPDQRVGAMYKLKAPDIVGLGSQVRSLSTSLGSKEVQIRQKIRAMASMTH